MDIFLFNIYILNYVLFLLKNMKLLNFHDKLQVRLWLLVFVIYIFMYTYYVAKYYRYVYVIVALMYTMFFC